jgi:hypothetical protein
MDWPCAGMPRSALSYAATLRTPSASRTVGGPGGIRDRNAADSVGCSLRKSDGASRCSPQWARHDHGGMPLRRVTPACLHVRRLVSISARWTRTWGLHDVRLMHAWRSIWRPGFHMSAAPSELTCAVTSWLPAPPRCGVAGFTMTTRCGNLDRGIVSCRRDRVRSAVEVLESKPGATNSVIARAI